MEAKDKISTLQKWLSKKIVDIKHLLYYLSIGIWNEPAATPLKKIIKVINITIKVFLDKDLHMRAAALTYQTLLAIVPTLAMLFAIGRGFGFQNIIQSELFKMIPSQQKAMEEAFIFVERYLTHSSEGIFLGIGLIFLLWSVTSLLSMAEDNFNTLWGIQKNRSFYRKVTDYAALSLMLPILLICSGGISLFMSSTVQSILPFKFLSPVLAVILDIAPFILSWLLYMIAFTVVPNTKVFFKNTIVAGILCGTATQVLQWLFITGQIYVSNYNAIYGSFAFLPLFLLWTQLVWLICLVGVVISYSSQNVGGFDYYWRINNISRKYFFQILVIELAIIVKAFKEGNKPYTMQQITDIYNIPLALNRKILKVLKDTGYVNETYDNTTKMFAYQPAFDINTMTVQNVYNKMRDSGSKLFISDLDIKYKRVMNEIEEIISLSATNLKETFIKDIDITIKKQ